MEICYCARCWPRMLAWVRESLRVRRQWTPPAAPDWAGLAAQCAGLAAQAKEVGNGQT